MCDIHECTILNSVDARWIRVSLRFICKSPAVVGGGSVSIENANFALWLYVAYYETGCKSEIWIKSKLRVVVKCRCFTCICVRTLHVYIECWLVALLMILVNLPPFNTQLVSPVDPSIRNQPQINCPFPSTFSRGHNHINCARVYVLTSIKTSPMRARVHIYAVHAEAVAIAWLHDTGNNIMHTHTHTHIFNMIISIILASELECIQYQ